MEVKFDQHFLNNQEILNKIINNSKITNEDIIYEIGIGEGILTNAILSKNPKHLISIEKDLKLLEKIQKITAKHKNFTFEIADGIEKFDEYKFNKLIANIPYSITEPLYKKIIEKKIPFCIILQGKKFFDICQNKNSKWYYYINSLYNLELIETVNGKNFNPPTKVTSVIVKLEIKKNLTKENKLILKLFEKKDRNFKNAIIFTLVEELNITKKQSKEIFEKLNMNLTEKFENISNEKFCDLIKKLKSYLNE